MDCDYRLDLGVFVLGQLSGPEEAQLRAHLYACPPCRAELTELQNVADILARARKGAGRRKRSGASLLWLSGACAARGPRP
ncbi:zf-HC2 domain-containing protein [Actinomadura barringtoniae]|uniref:Zf-HC2 domain-containing protein n=1 Tax=Actinomadura barringtoniae TaxID=1427535 RepID=A0A939PF74_9ACTN|nr:zf-HC2 domain-containing protein [Actinomadura barringtoniae]